MKCVHTDEKKELLAKLAAFNYSGMETKISGNICYHYQPFVRRDYKALAQIALYLFGPYLQPAEKAVWLALSKQRYSKGGIGNSRKPEGTMRIAHTQC